MDGLSGRRVKWSLRLFSNVRFGGLSGQDGLSGHLRIFQISESAAGAENFKKHKKIMIFYAWKNVGLAG